MSEPIPQSTRVRTSDVEREKIVTVLRTAVGEGRLTLEEGDERIAAAYAAKYRDELGPLTTDLPGDPGRATRREGDRNGEHWHGRHWHGHGGPWGRRPRFFPFPLLFLIGLITLLVWLGVHFWPTILIVILSIMFLRRIVWWGAMRRYRRHRGGQDAPWSGRVS